MVPSTGDCPNHNQNKMNNITQEATELLARAFEATFKRIEAEIMRLRKESK